MLKILLRLLSKTKKLLSMVSSAVHDMTSHCTSGLIFNCSHFPSCALRSSLRPKHLHDSEQFVMLWPLPRLTSSSLFMRLIPLDPTQMLPPLGALLVLTIRNNLAFHRLIALRSSNTVGNTSTDNTAGSILTDNMLGCVLIGLFNRYLTNTAN